MPTSRSKAWLEVFLGPKRSWLNRVAVLAAIGSSQLGALNLAIAQQEPPPIFQGGIIHQLRSLTAGSSTPEHTHNHNHEAAAPVMPPQSAVRAPSNLPKPPSLNAPRTNEEEASSPAPVVSARKSTSAASSANIDAEEPVAPITRRDATIVAEPPKVSRRPLSNTESPSVVDYSSPATTLPSTQSPSIMRSDSKITLRSQSNGVNMVLEGDSAARVQVAERRSVSVPSGDSTMQLSLPVGPTLPTLKPTTPTTQPTSQFQTASSPLPALPNSELASSTRNPIRQVAPTVSQDDRMSMETPRLQVLLKGPADIPIGTPANYSVVVRNVDNISLSGVILRLDVPQGVQVAPAKPSLGEMEVEAAQDGTTLLSWSFTGLAPQQTATAPLELVADAPKNFALAMEWTILPLEGQANIEVLQPRLELAIEGPSEVEYGVPHTYHLLVRNPGSSPAENISVQLSAEQYGSSKADVGTIQPGQQQTIDVELTFNQRGTISIGAVANGNGGLVSNSAVEVLVKQAILSAELFGPESVYFGSPANYEVRLKNNGDLAAKNVRAALQLPRGAQVVAKPDGAIIENGQLKWTVPQIAVGKVVDSPIQLQLNSPGEQQLALQCSSPSCSAVTTSLVTKVEAISDLKLFVNDPVAPAPVGNEVVYELTINNRGSRSAINVRTVAQFSDGIEPVRAEGYGHQLVTGQVLFDAIPEIRSGETKLLRVYAKAQSAGTHRFRVDIRSDESDLRLVQEETTQYLNTNRVASPVNNNGPVMR